MFALMLIRIKHFQRQLLLAWTPSEVYNIRYIEPC